MTKRSWGKVTPKTGGSGEGDPNVLKLGDSQRIRLLENDGAEPWRQHAIRSPEDDDQFRSVVCPKGADGRGSMPCPLCLKSADKDGERRFPISRRFAANVWDYESGSIKVLIGGPQIFEEFDSVAAVGIDPTSLDWIIHKTGKGIGTKYKMVRGDQTAFEHKHQPSDLFELGKYSDPDSVERIFEKLEEMGIDYDALELPFYTFEQAEAFVMPFGKHKDQTLELLYATEKEYLEWMHDTRMTGGQYDAVFMAIQTILEHYGDVPPLDTDIAPAPPAPAQSAPPAETPESPDSAPGMVLLVSPAGEEVQMPESTVDALLAAGFTHPVQAEPATPALADTDEVEVTIGGQNVILKYGDAKPLIESGTATLSQADTPQTHREPAPPPFQFPMDDDEVQVKLKALPAPIPMAYKDAGKIVTLGQGEFADPELASNFKLADKIDEHEVKTDIAAETAEAPDAIEQAETGNQLDPALTEGPMPDTGRFQHPAIPGKDFATKGAVTQALNRMKRSASPSESPQSANGEQPAAGTGNGDLTGKEAKLEAAKKAIAAKPELSKDFNDLLKLFEEVAGKRNIQDFDEAELDKLLERPELAGA